MKRPLYYLRANTINDSLSGDVAGFLSRDHC